MLMKCKTSKEIYQRKVRYFFEVADKLGQDMTWVPLSQKQYIWMLRCIMDLKLPLLNGCASLRNVKGTWHLFIDKARWPKSDNKTD